MKNSFLFLSILLNSFAFAQDGWFQQNVPKEISQLNCIFAVSENLVFAVGDSSKIIRTTDGGDNWNIVFTNDTLPTNLFTVFFADSLNGWTVGGSFYKKSIILKTEDGGNNWYYQITNASMPLYSIFFINKDTGWIAGEYGTILKTEDGGNSWIQKICDANKNSFKKIHFINSKFGYIVGTEAGWGNTPYGVFLSTTDGGETWLKEERNDLYSMFFLDKNNGWIIGNAGKYSNKGLIYFTNDSGLNWESKINDIPNWSSISFINVNDGWATAYYYLYYTHDGGLNWFREDSQQGYNYCSIHFVNNKTGWVIGNIINWATSYRSTIILKTQTGGVSGIEDKTISIAEKFILSQNYPNPFNPETKIKYTIPENVGTRPGVFLQVSLKIYDILGNEVATLVNEEKPAGEYEVEFDGSKLSSGIYLYVLSIGSFEDAGGQSLSRKMILIK